MTAIPLESEERIEFPPRTTEHREVYAWSYPLTFDEFIELKSFDKTDSMELLDGVVVEKPMVQLEHEKLLVWLLALSHTYVEEQNFGLVLGSRTAVEINKFKGRLPDMLFVRRERLHIVQQKAIYGAPDLVIELVSPNDRPADLAALEADYRILGVPEILFIDQQKRRVIALRQRGHEYERQELTSGALPLEALSGFRLELDWLFIEPRPNILATLALLREKA